MFWMIWVISLVKIFFYFTEGRNKFIQMIVMCHKTAQIETLARKNCDTVYITYSGADLFENFKEMYKYKQA